MICPRCNTTLREGLKFCPKCGYSLKAYPPVSSADPVQQTTSSPERREPRSFPPELTASVDIHEKRIAQDSLNPDLYIAFGDLYRDYKYYEEALVQYQKAVNIDNTAGEVFMRLGEIYRYIGQYEKSASTYQRALKLLPSSAEAAQGLLKAFMGLKRYPQAEELGKEIAEKEPANIVAHKALRDIYLENRNIEAAIEEVKTIINLQPDKKEQYILLGELYENKDDKGNALAQYRKALNIDGGDKAALYNAGRMYYDTGESVMSQQCFERLADIDPPTAPTLIYLTLASTESGNIDKASSALKKLDLQNTIGISEEMKHLLARAYLLTAQKLQEENRLKDATKFLERSLRVMKNEDAARNLAAIYAREGEEAFARKSYHEAKNSYLKASELASDNRDYTSRIEEIRKILSGKRKKTIISISIPAAVVILVIVGFFTWRHFTSGVLTITYQSYEAERIEVDGKEYKGGSLTLQSGEHTIFAKGWPSYKDFTQKIVLKGGEKKEMNIALEMEKQQMNANNQNEITSPGQYEGAIESEPGFCEQGPDDRTYCRKLSLVLNSGGFGTSSLHTYTKILKDGKVIYGGSDDSKCRADQHNDFDKIIKENLKPSTRVTISTSCGDLSCSVDVINILQ